MCGLIGAAGDLTGNYKDIFTEMLLVDVVRGHHSTGAAAVKRYNDEILVEKAPVPSQLFVGSEAYRKFIDTLGLKVLIGHNRYATVGEKSVANAHPFQFDNLVGAHNGTLDNWALKRLEDQEYFGTDSEALYNSVSKYGIRETIEKLSGAWALTWFDKTQNTINLLRNPKRPLFYAYNIDRTTLFWGSEAHMLEWLLVRNHVKIFENEIYACDPDKHYRWEVPDKLGVKFDKPTCQEIKESTFKHVQNFSYKDNEEDWDKWLDRGGYNPHTVFGNSSVVTTPAQNVKKASTQQKLDSSNFRPPYKDALDKVITKPEFLELIAGGCVFCDESNTVWGEFIYPLMDDMDGRKLYLCKPCYDDNDVMTLIENSYAVR